MHCGLEATTYSILNNSDHMISCEISPIEKWRINEQSYCLGHAHDEAILFLLFVVRLMVTFTPIINHSVPSTIGQP